MLCSTRSNLSIASAATSTSRVASIAARDLSVLVLWNGGFDLPSLFSYRNLGPKTVLACLLTLSERGSIPTATDLLKTMAVRP
ncbi:hypothetical protein FNV43_RR09979 [Rhamnella rubrinervis]|uniref:Uncharacterized protein n=1 Tax=Rhamnella rubrinervis TaxID=2594499 RepID=A0A8K0HAX5_9ROSA|nr:hypothetical protein FNV43_RR09979 [Rhamnella rubrinervis]